jgi:hypothetical protein
MKKRTIRKVKKLLPRIVMVALSLFFLMFFVNQSIDNFIQLHNGASYASVEGRRYSPVISETLVMMGAGVILLAGIKLVTKWNNLRILGLAGVVYAAIGLFTYWALDFTRQNIVNGFSTLAVLVLAIAAFVIFVLMYERLVQKKRKQTHGKHPIVKLSDAIEKRKEYVCLCGTPDRVFLGLHWMKAVNIMWTIILSLIILFALFDSTLLMIALAFAFLFAGIATYNYRYLYRSMIKNGHTPSCANRCARLGVWYQAKSSGFYAYTPRPSKAKERILKDAR